jgi:hypothetical protein
MPHHAIGLELPKDRHHLACWKAQADGHLARAARTCCAALLEVS